MSELKFFDAFLRIPGEEVWMQRPPFLLSRGSFTTAIRPKLGAILEATEKKASPVYPRM